MKFVCTQENLSQGLLITSHINTKNVNLPILNNVLLRVENNTLKLVATNLEIAVVVKIRGRAEVDGEFTVPAKLLSDYVFLLPKESVVLEVKNGFLHIECANNSTKIRGTEAQDFPLIPQLEKKHSFFLQAGEVRRALVQVAFAVSPSESRPEISGVYMNFNGELGAVTFVATDSFRLAEKKLPLDTRSAKDAISIIVPLKTVLELNNMLFTAMGDSSLLEVSLDESQVFFSYNNAEITSRVIEGAFPDYVQIFPKEYKTRALLSVKSLIGAAKSASLFSRTGLNDIKFNIFCDKNKIEVYSTDNQTGEQKTLLDGDVSGDDNKITLNYKYLVDGLNNLGADEAVLDVIDENSPCVIKSKDDPSYLYIVMPIKQ